jgi:hypothetical protein
MKPLSPLEAHAEIMAFASERGEHALNLALHAAVPQTFRPSFLHLLRLNFVPEALDESWIEADVLFSPFCEHLGGGYHRFDATTRWLLIENLARNFPSETPARLQRVANLLAAWLDTLERSKSHTDEAAVGDYISVERWVALAYLNPEAAAAQLTRALDATLDGGHAAARLHLGGLMSSLASPLAGHANLLTYAAGVMALGEGRLSDARRILDTLPDAPINVAGATIRSPRTVVAALPKRPIESVRLVRIRSAAIVVSQAEPFGIILNLDCEFLNPQEAPATIHRLEARLEDPRGQSFHLRWNAPYERRSLQRKTGQGDDLSLRPGEHLSVGVQFKASMPVNPLAASHGKQSAASPAPRERGSLPPGAQRYEWSAGIYGLEAQVSTEYALSPAIEVAYEIDVTSANAGELRSWTGATAQQWAALGNPDNAVGIPVAVRPLRPSGGLVVLVHRKSPIPMVAWFRSELEKTGYEVDERSVGDAMAGVQPRFFVIDLRENLSRHESIALLTNPRIPVIVPAGPVAAPWHIHLNEMNIVQGIDEAERYLAHPPADVESVRSRLLAQLGALPLEEFERATDIEQRKEIVRRVQFELERGERVYSAADASSMAASQWALERITCYLVWERQPPSDVYLQMLAVEREANQASGSAEASLMSLHFAVRSLRRRAEKEPEVFSESEFSSLTKQVENVLASRPPVTGNEIRGNLDFIRQLAPWTKYERTPTKSVRGRTHELVDQLRETQNAEEWRRISIELVPLLTAYWDVHPHSAMEMLESTVNNLPVSLANPLVRAVVRGWKQRPNYNPDAGGNAGHCYLAALILSENFDLAEPEWASRVMRNRSKWVRDGARDEKRKRELVVGIAGIDRD